MATVVVCCVKPTCSFPICIKGKQRIQCHKKSLETYEQNLPGICRVKSKNVMPTKTKQPRASECSPTRYSLSHGNIKHCKICMGYWPSVRSRWLDIDQVPFLRVYGPRNGVEVHKNAKKNKANVQPSSIWFITSKNNTIVFRDTTGYPAGAR